jgi:hypothetical protein
VKCEEAELTGTFGVVKPSTGTAVLAGFRPQEAYLLTEGAEAKAANVLEGTVESLVGYGATDTAVVRVEELGKQIELAVPRAQAARIELEEGNSVRIGVPHGALWLVERD